MHLRARLRELCCGRDPTMAAAGRMCEPICDECGAAAGFSAGATEQPAVATGPSERGLSAARASRASRNSRAAPRRLKGCCCRRRPNAMKIVIPDEYQDMVHRLPSYALIRHHDVVRYRTPARDLDQLVERLREADVVVAIRERVKFSRALLLRLPALKLLALVGRN